MQQYVARFEMALSHLTPSGDAHGPWRSPLIAGSPPSCALEGYAPIRSGLLLGSTSLGACPCTLRYVNHALVFCLGFHPRCVFLPVLQLGSMRTLWVSCCNPVWVAKPQAFELNSCMVSVIALRFDARQ
jgi:hypothetical protein